VRVFRRVGIRAVVVVIDPRAAEVAYVTLFAAIRGYVQKVMQQEFPDAVPFGPVE